MHVNRYFKYIILFIRKDIGVVLIFNETIICIFNIISYLFFVKCLNLFNVMIYCL